MTTSSKTTNPCCDVSRERKHPRRHNRRGKALSAVALTTMALSSPALGLTAVQRRSPQSRVTCISTAACTTSHVSQMSKSQLRYRNGDDDESSSRRIEHAEAASQVRLPAVPATSLRRWFGSIVSPNEGPRAPLPSSSSKGSKEQHVLDDYLEYIDKRYHRLHDDDEAEQPSDGGRPGINTAWNWLMKQTPGSELEAQQGKEDALCVLGLAELASAELLQKHHLPLPKSEFPREAYKVTASVVIDAQAYGTEESAVGQPKTVPTNGRVASISAGLSVLRRLQERQAAIAALQLRATLFAFIRAMGRSTASTVKSLSTAVPALIAMGGGAKTLKTAAVLSAVFLVVLRPITRVAIEV